MASVLLKEVRARDLMSTNVITLPGGAPLREAIEIFEDEHITGLPVVDSGGKVVGVLSEHDLARAGREGRLGEHGDSSRAGPREEAYHELALGEDPVYSKEDYSTELLGTETVGDWMRPEVVSVEPDTTLKALCERMVTESIHRVLVLDRGRPVGIVTTSDVVRFVADSL